MSSRKYTWNAFETTLNGSTTSGATTITLASVTGLRAPGYIVLEPDDAAKREYISFTGISSNDLTGVTRGLDGGQAGTAHDSGSTVRSVMMHQFIDDLFTDIEALEAVDTGHVGGNDAADHPEATASARGFATAAQITKLDAIEAGAEVNDSAAEILTKVKTVDGTGSGLDADLLDGVEGAGYAPVAHVGGTGAAHGPATGAVDGFLEAGDKTKLDGIETGAEVNDSAAEILTKIKTVDGTGSGLDADLLDGLEAAALAPVAHTHLEADVTDLSHVDATAIHDNVSAEISALTEKTTPVDTDLILIEDSAASFAKKKIQVSSIVGGLVQLDEVTLGGSAAEIQFSSIDSGYTQYYVVGRLRTDRSASAEDGIAVRVGNGTPDTGNNYSWIRDTDGDTEAVASNTSDDEFLMAYGVQGDSGSSPAGQFSMFELRIYDPNDTSYQRAIRMEGAAWTSSLQQRSVLHGNWENTADSIDVIEVQPSAGSNFLAGSKLTLFGLV